REPLLTDQELTSFAASVLTRNRDEKAAVTLEGGAPVVTAIISSEERAKRRVRRVNVNFSDKAYVTLERLAHQTGKSMSDVLRDAIALKDWFEQTRAEGGHVLVERSDGKVREVISV